MKCNICGKEIDGYGNNPWPICANDDTKSRCCDECNQRVIQARLLKSRGEDKKIESNDLVIIFYSKESNAPIELLLTTGKFLAGIVDIDEQTTKMFYGTWGNFALDPELDSYAIFRS